MEKLNEIQNKIYNNFGKLPTNQKQIAEYFLDNFERIPFLSVYEIAEATSRSVASVVRFAQRIGYSGFSELRDEMTGSLQNRIGKKNVFPLAKNKKKTDDPLTAVANQDIQNINDTLNLIERNDFKRTINIIDKSQRVFTMGLGISTLLSQILSYQLNLVGVDSRPLNHGSASFVEQILFLTESDLLIGFSFPPYSKSTIQAAQLAHEKGISVVALTDDSKSPINKYADNRLLIKSENLLFTNSFAAISVVINALTTELSVRDKKTTLEFINHVNQLMNRSGHFEL